MHYNLFVFSIFIRLFASLMIIIGTQGNFDLNFTNRICDDMLKTFLFIIRLIVMIYIFFFILPDFSQLLRDTSHLNSKNWWKNDEEKFLTNISPFNAAMCWFLYGIFAFILFFVIYMYIPVVIIANLIYLIRESPSTRQAIRY